MNCLWEDLRKLIWQRCLRTENKEKKRLPEQMIYFPCQIPVLYVMISKDKSKEDDLCYRQLSQSIR